MGLFKRSRPPQTQLELPGMPPPKQPARGKPRGGPIKRARMHLVTVPVSRRRFLSGTLGWVTLAIAAALGIPAAAAVVSPMLRKEEQGWSPVGRLDEPKPGEPDLRVEGEPILTQFTSLFQDAYLKAAPHDVAIFVENNGGADFTILDDRCTHLGCPFEWKKEDEKFYCPCHGGEFDFDGRVLAGPPPRPLDRYEYKVENGVLYVGKLYQVDDRLQRVTF